MTAEFGRAALLRGFGLLEAHIGMSVVDQAALGNYNGGGNGPRSSFATVFHAGDEVAPGVDWLSAPVTPGEGTEGGRRKSRKNVDSIALRHSLCARFTRAVSSKLDTSARLRQQGKQADGFFFP